MISAINILLLVTGAVATLSAFGGRTWVDGQTPILTRVTVRGWISLSCLAIALSLGVSKELISKKLSSQKGEAQNLERQALLKQIETLRKRTDLIITSEELALFDVGAEFGMLSERLGKPEKQFDVEGFVCRSGRQLYARWSDIGGNSIQAVFGKEDLKAIGYAVQASKQSYAEGSFPIFMSDEDPYATPLFYSDARIAGYAEWRSGSAPDRYLDVWSGWQATVPIVGMIRSWIEEDGKGYAGYTRLKDGPLNDELSKLFSSERSKYGYFASASEGTDCGAHLDRDDERYFPYDLPEGATSQDFVMLKRLAFVSLSFQIFEEWFHIKL